MRLLIIPLTLMALGFLLMSTLGSGVNIPESLDDLVPWLQGFEQWAWLAAGSVIAADSVLPMPSSPAMFTLGIVYGPWLGGVVGGVASVLAGLIGFGLVRALGHRGALWVVGDADLARAERFYERWGVAAVALGKAVGGPAEWVVILAGLSRMPTAQVLLGIGIGAFPAGFCMAWLGHMAIDRPELAGVLTLLIVLAVLVASHKLAPAPSTHGDLEEAP